MHFSYINREVVQNIYIYTGREGRDHEITDRGGGPGRRHIFLTASRSGNKNNFYFVEWKLLYRSTTMMARREVWSGSVLRRGEVTNSHAVAASFVLFLYLREKRGGGWSSSAARHTRSSLQASLFSVEIVQPASLFLTCNPGRLMMDRQYILCMYSQKPFVLNKL